MKPPGGDAAVAVARQPGVVRVRVPARSLGSELRAIKVVWKRELIRFSHDRLRILTALMQPFLFLFVLGTGLSRIARPAPTASACARSSTPGCFAWR